MRSYVRTETREPQDGHASITRHYHWEGNEFRDSVVLITYEWFGDPRLPVYISSGDWNHEFKNFGPLPWRLVKVGDSEGWDPGGGTYIRKDAPVLWRFRAVWIGRCLPWLRMVGRRIIQTLAVWRLASYEAGAIPTWRNIHCFRRMARRVGARKRA